MSIEANKAIARRLVEEVQNQQNISAEFPGVASRGLCLKRPRNCLTRMFSPKTGERP
jgi:hypothetical protein